MSISEWQEKFSSIVKQTESNLDRAKQSLSSAKLPHMFSGGSFNSFAAPERMVYSASGYTPHGFSDTAIAEPRLSASESSGSALALHHLPPNVADEARYIPLHQSSSVITFLHDKIDEQAKTIEDLAKSLRRNEEEKESFQRELHDVRNEIHRLHSGGVGREMDSLIEQRLDKLRQEMTAEFKLMNQKYNNLKNRDEEAAVAMETRNSSITSTIIDLQKYVRGETESIRREMASLDNRLSKVEGEVFQIVLTAPKSSAIADQDIRFREPWQATGQTGGGYGGGKNSVSFHHDFDRPKSFQAPNDLVQISTLKNSLKELERKLNSLETNILPESKIAGSVHRKAKQKQRSISSRTLLSPSTSDLDVSTLTDLVTFSCVDGKSNGSQSFDPNFTVASDLSSEEDLTLDDL